MTSHDLTRSPSHDPLPLFRMRDGLYAVDLLTAAVSHLEIFSRLGCTPMSLDLLCAELRIHPRPADVLMTLLKSMDLIEETAGVFHLKPLAREHMLPDSPWFIGPYYAGMKNRSVTLDFLSVLRSGKPANWASLKDEKAWAQAMEQETFARDFTAAMDSRGIYLGQALAKAIPLQGRSRLLDVAGGSGIYACCFAAANPALSCTVLEKHPVDHIALKAVASRGFTERIDVARGDMFRDQWPSDADVHLISNVLHDWDFPEVRAILHKSNESLRPGGLLIIHDMHLNEAKTGPLPVAQYSALLMCITEGKCYSISELNPLLEEAGFTAGRLIPTAADRSALIAEKRR